MGRVIVLGAKGFFGAALCEELTTLGVPHLKAARRAPADLVLDVENTDQLANVLQPGDIILDAAGPFQKRTTALIRAALAKRCDVLDLADHVGYVRAVQALKPQIDAAGIRVVSACSSLSAVTASLIRASGIRAPAQFTVCMLPSAKKSATRGTALSLLSGVGSPVTVWENRIPTAKTGWGETRTFKLPAPSGVRQAHLFESVDALLLPKLFPTLSHVSCYVDSNVPGFNAALFLASRSSFIRALMRTALPLGLALSRILGTERGVLACEIEGDNERAAFVLNAETNAYRTAVLPLALSAKALLSNKDAPKGLLAPDTLFSPEELLSALQSAGVTVRKQTVPL